MGFNVNSSAPALADYISSQLVNAELIAHVAGKESPDNLVPLGIYSAFATDRFGAADKLASKGSTASLSDFVRFDQEVSKYVGVSNLATQGGVSPTVLTKAMLNPDVVNDLGGLEYAVQQINIARNLNTVPVDALANMEQRANANRDGYVGELVQGGGGQPAGRNWLRPVDGGAVRDRMNNSLTNFYQGIREGDSMKYKLEGPPAPLPR